jgi:YNFM family putative membrane transporter
MNANDTYLHKGTPAYRSASIALFCCGFATFALLYTVQPLLPLFSKAFAIDAATASWAVSAATIGVAVSLIPIGIVSDRLGRKQLMAASQLLVVGLTLAVAVSPGWKTVLVLRFLSGVALSGVPAVATAYLAEEVEPQSLGSVMGLYIGGNAMGGMAGRLLTGVLADVTHSWRWSVGIVAALGLVAALTFIRLLPPSRRFEPAPAARTGERVRVLLELFREPTLPWLFAAGFVLMGAFVALFNITGYRLTGAPFHLSNTHVGAIFLVYAIGAPVSAWFGAMGDKVGRGRMIGAAAGLMLLGLLVTLPDNLILIALGLAMVTGGFFGAQALCSAWAASRVPSARGQASSLYLFFYYLGPALFGAIAGKLWNGVGWTGVAIEIGTMNLALFLIVFLSPLGRADRRK